jgi:hypothetical protein
MPSSPRGSCRWLRKVRPDLPFRCAIGGGPAEHCDHIVPRSMGGTNDPANCRFLCAFHNILRGGGNRRGGHPLSDEKLREFDCASYRERLPFLLARKCLRREDDRALRSIPPFLLSPTEARARYSSPARFPWCRPPLKGFRQGVVIHA